MTHRPVVNPNHKPWTIEEDAIIRDQYVALNGKVGHLLPDRSASSIRKRAQHVGVQVKRKWTHKDRIIVEDSWGRVPVEEIARRIGRKPDAVYYYARHIMGLCGSVPQGMETLTHAAERTGFDTCTLRRVLFASHVHIYRPSYATSYKSGRRFVEPLDVDEAVAAWLRTENVGEAATRRGLDQKYLRSWLIMAHDAGVCELPPEPAKNKHWRVSTETIDRVLEWQSSLLTARQVAARCGLAPYTIGQWLIASGMRRIGKRYWYVTWEQAKEVVAKFSARSPLARSRLRPGVLEAA